MAGFCRGQGVPLHRGLHQLGASTNSNKMLYRLGLITVACTGVLAQPSCFALEYWPWLTFLYNYIVNCIIIILY